MSVRLYAMFTFSVLDRKCPFWLNVFQKVNGVCLRRYDTIKACCSELFIIVKYLKSRFKSRGSPCYFLSSRGQKIKNITKIEQNRLLLFAFLVSFFMEFLAQKTNLHNKYMI